MDTKHESDDAGTPSPTGMFRSAAAENQFFAELEADIARERDGILEAETEAAAVEVRVVDEVHLIEKDLTQPTDADIEAFEDSFDDEEEDDNGEFDDEMEDLADDERPT